MCESGDELMHRLAWLHRLAWRAMSGCVLLTVLAATSACGGSAGSSTPRANGPAYEVTTARLSGLGTVLVSGKGLTLYIYLPDAQSSHSRCTDVCAGAWPPVELPAGVSSAPIGGEARASLIGTTTRPGGGMQVTYNGWPLYTWTGDSGPGQATGQGIYNLGGLWYVINPDGTPVR